MYYVARQYELMCGKFQYVFLHKNKATVTTVISVALSFALEAECEKFIRDEMERGTAFRSVFVKPKTNKLK